jgi:hypothetical protein
MRTAKTQVVLHITAPYCRLFAADGAVRQRQEIVDLVMPSPVELPLPLRIARSLRGLRMVRGGLAFARFALPRYAGREFVVENGQNRYVCDLSSYIEWNLAVFADYEGPEKKLFAQVLKAGKRQVMLYWGQCRSAQPVLCSYHAPGCRI